MGKIAIILLNNNSYYFPYLNRNDVDIISICGNNEIFWLRLCKYIPYVIEKKIKNKLKKNKYDTVIIFDSALQILPNLIDSIQRLKTRKILYFWNMINGERLKLTKKFFLFDKVFSFSAHDCKKYNMRYMPLMAYNILDNIKLPIEQKYDFFFLGYLKQRKEQILKLITKLNDFKCKFVIISNEKFNNNDLIEFRNTRLNYEEYINLLSQTKCIIDISNENQDGFTLRMAEAFCYNKKIITTNKNVIESDFYDDSRILLYSEELSYVEILNFLNRPLRINYDNPFEFSIWLKKIVED